MAKQNRDEILEKKECFRISNSEAYEVRKILFNTDPKLKPSMLYRYLIRQWLAEKKGEIN